MKTKRTARTDNQGNTVVKYNFDSDYDTFCINIQDSTYNCQLAIFGGIEELLDYDEKEAEKIIDREFEVFNMFLFDISLNSYNKHVKLFQNYIKSLNSNYVSTNGNTRKILIIKQK